MVSAPSLGIAGRLAAACLNSVFTPIFMVFCVLAGALALLNLPREEEPQIVVPTIDLLVDFPGASSREVEQRVAKPLEKLAWEIPGVEYVYSISRSGSALVTVRYLVGFSEETGLVRLKEKIDANLDLIPPGVSRPLIKNRSIDDVAIVALTLWSSRYGDFELRRIAAQVRDTIQQTEDVSVVTLLGGQKREVLVSLEPERLTAYMKTPLDICRALQQANVERIAGEVAQRNRRVIVQAGSYLKTAGDVGSVVLGASAGKPVFIRDIATVSDEGAEPTEYVRYGEKGQFHPAVTISAGKRKGTNAVIVARNIISRVEALRGRVIPSDVNIAVTRQHGETADEKSSELISHMTIAVISVGLLIAIMLGWRASLIVFLAVPATLALTLTMFFFFGYTLNRITLFALIFSIGILVDDAIVVVENIVRRWNLPGASRKSTFQCTVEAVAEVGNPTILATAAVIAAILPMAFVGGLMGPYMRPIPVGASAAMLSSLLVAFIVTPWAAIRILKRGAGHHETAEDAGTRIYRGAMRALLTRTSVRWAFLSGVALLLVASCSLLYFRIVKVKMLPFDNKSELQVIVDMPEDTTLEGTNEAAGALAAVLSQWPEVTNVETYAGTASPYNFNGLVRHYFLRAKPWQADLQVNLLPKRKRSLQSHEIAESMRQALLPTARKYGAKIKIAEVPPGPPVLHTLVAEVYGPSMESRTQIARQVRNAFRAHDGVVDVDWLVEDDQPKYELRLDREKASLSGIDDTEVLNTLTVAVGGRSASLLHVQEEHEDVPINVRLSRASRSDFSRIGELKLHGSGQQMVALADLVKPAWEKENLSIYRKNLLPVTYVTAEVAGSIESPAYAMIDLRDPLEKIKMPDGKPLRIFFTQPPQDGGYGLKWDGEWQVTYEVFRDLGIAFAIVLLLIFALVAVWFNSISTPLVIMAAIPFSIVGILPAHALLGAFFSATSMIGFIAGAGIVVRNSIILIDFVRLRLDAGVSLEEAVVEAGAVRFRPMLMTALAVIAGSAVILFDPIFQGLAVTLMSGEIASLLLSRMTVPVLYFMANRRSYRMVEVTV